ncbi:MAG: HD domain-containing phosphohydrolase [Bacillota bacterium]|nr:HD domain-containing phosphohydrolase [Bacillota bacterium]
MKKNKRPILKYMRKDLAAATAIEIFIILCLVVALYKVNTGEYERAALVNVLGKQRMFTQMMAKDANRKYELMQAELLGNIVEPEDVIKEKRNQINNNIEAALKQFDSTQSQLKQGRVNIEGKSIGLGGSRQSIGENLASMNRIWENFEESLEIVRNQEIIDSKFINAVIYINDNNEALMNYSNDITETLINDKKSEDFYYKAIAAAAVLLFLVTLVILLVRLFRYLILPFDAFIAGMSDIGMLKKESRLGKTTKKEVAPVILEVDRMSQKIERLISLIESVNQNLSISQELEFIFNKFSFFIPYSYIGVALVKDEGSTLEASYGISDGSVTGMPEKLIGKRFDISRTSLKRIIETAKPRVINDLESYNSNKVVSEYNRIIMASGIQSSITLPLISNGRPIGLIFFSSTSKNAYNEEHIQFLNVIAQSIAISFDKNIFVDNLLYSSILALAKLAEARDEDTGEHLDRMKKYSKLIAQLLFEDSLYKDQITLDYIDHIERFSPMHDIGKVGIRDDILLKPAKLTAEEFNEMKQHTVFGGKVLRAAEENIIKSGISIFKVGIEIAEGHHEKWDGSGYPMGLSGCDIPLSARIVAAADVLDALTSKRPYKKAFPFEESFNYIVEGSAKHFDPEIVRILIRNMERIYKLYKSFQVNE